MLFIKYFVKKQLKMVTWNPTDLKTNKLPTRYVKKNLPSKHNGVEFNHFFEIYEFMFLYKAGRTIVHDRHVGFLFLYYICISKQNIALNMHC